MLVKACSRCGEELPLDQFSKNGGGRRRASCKACDGRKYRQWRDSNPEHARRAWREASNRYEGRFGHLWKKYGLSRVDYQRMVEEQGGACRICGHVSDELVVDHCHETGFVRALLCNNCNTGIGMLGDDADRVEAAALYLRTIGLTGFRAADAQKRTVRQGRPAKQLDLSTFSG